MIELFVIAFFAVKQPSNPPPIPPPERIEAVIPNEIERLKKPIIQKKKKAKNSLFTLRRIKDIFCHSRKYKRQGTRNH